MPPSSSSRPQIRGGGRAAPAAANPAVQGHGGGRERGGKEEGGAGARSLAAAGPEAARGGLAATAGGSGRRVALGRRPRGVVAVKGVGESTGELRGSISPAHLGLEWSREVGPREAGAAAALRGLGES